MNKDLDLDSISKKDLIKEERLINFINKDLKPLYFVLFFLTVIDVICFSYMIIVLDEYIVSSFSFIVFIGTIYYALTGYKKKNSQVLRIILLLFSVILVFIPIIFFSYLISIGVFEIEHKIFLLLNATSSCLVAFVAGRIRHYQKNKIFVILVFVLLLAASLIEFETITNYQVLYNTNIDISSLSFFDKFIGYLLPFVTVIEWGCLMIAYTVKFQNHELIKHKHRHHHKK